MGLLSQIILHDQESLDNCSLFLLAFLRTIKAISNTKHVSNSFSESLPASDHLSSCKAKTKKVVVKPRELFSELCRIFPTYKQLLQEDAHEVYVRIVDLIENQSKDWLLEARTHEANQNSSSSKILLSEETSQHSVMNSNQTIVEAMSNLNLSTASIHLNSPIIQYVNYLKNLNVGQISRLKLCQNCRKVIIKKPHEYLCLSLELKRS